jgi:hypothetical protein
MFQQGPGPRGRLDIATVNTNLIDYVCRARVTGLTNSLGFVAPVSEVCQLLLPPQETKLLISRKNMFVRGNTSITGNAINSKVRFRNDVGFPPSLPIKSKTSLNRKSIGRIIKNHFSKDSNSSARSHLSSSTWGALEFQLSTRDQASRTQRENNFVSIRGTRFGADPTGNRDVTFSFRNLGKPLVIVLLCLPQGPDSASLGIETLSRFGVQVGVLSFEMFHFAPFQVCFNADVGKPSRTNFASPRALLKGDVDRSLIHLHDITKTRTDPNAPTLFASVPGLQVIAFEFQQAFAGVGAGRDGDVELT